MNDVYISYWNWGFSNNNPTEVTALDFDSKCRAVIITSSHHLHVPQPKKGGFVESNNFCCWNVICCLLFVFVCWFVVDVLLKCAVATIPVNEVQYSKRAPLARSHPSAFQPWHVRLCWSFVWFLWWKNMWKHQQHSTLLSWWCSELPKRWHMLLLMVQKSQTTTRDVWNPSKNGIIIILGGAGFRPSTVVQGLETPKVFDIETQSLQYQVTIPPRYLPPHARVTWIRDPRFFRVAGWRVTHGLIANLMFSNKGVVRSKSLKKYLVLKIDGSFPLWPKEVPTSC